MPPAPVRGVHRSRRSSWPIRIPLPMVAYNKILLSILSDGRFHSGTELAARLGLSRTAVWKHVRELEALGVRISALPGRGYRALSPVEPLDEAAIRAGLDPGAETLLAALEVHDQIDSTNARLMRAGPETPTGTACLAETQTAGRGRMGRQWVSPVGANIYLSLLWRYEEPSRVAGLSLAVGVAVVRALAGLGLADPAPDTGRLATRQAGDPSGLGLKWPNDLLWGDSKFGGILLEVAGEAHGPCKVVIGLGLNRHIPDEAGRSIDQAWSDLVRVAGSAAPPRNRLVAALLNELLPLLRDYPDQGLGPHLPDWRRYHRMQGREATLQQGDMEIHGRIDDVTDDGLLVLRCADGSLRRFASGDVRLRLTGNRDHG